MPLSGVAEVDSISQIVCHPNAFDLLPVGIWYKITGNGATLTASLLAGIDSPRIDIMSGPSCSELSCQKSCEGQFGQDFDCEWLSTQGEQYYVFVSYDTLYYGSEPTGAFALTVR